MTLSCILCPIDFSEATGPLVAYAAALAAGTGAELRLLHVLEPQPMLPGLSDLELAQQLARYFTQDSTSRIVAAERPTQFTIDYPLVNRLLPVWKITFDRPGVTTVYVKL